MPGTLVQGPQGWLCTLFPRFTISGLPYLTSLSSVATVESILGDGVEYTADYARGKHEVIFFKSLASLDQK